MRRRSIAPLLFAASTCALAAGAAACNYSYLQAPTSPSTADSSGSSAASGSTGSTTVTYANDVQPILASDCVRCHGPSRRDAGVDVSTYAAVMRLVTPGNPNSLLVFVTQPGGVMYGAFSGSRAQKATTIRDWVVSSNAAQQ